MRSVLLLVLLDARYAGEATDPMLAPGGTLRAAYIVANLAQARIDPATGVIAGVIADIARELGRRADAPVMITPLPTAAAVIEAVRSGVLSQDFAQLGLVYEIAGASEV